MNTRDKQRGGIVIFVIIGILLAGLLAGGLYLSKQQARVARENTPPAVAIDTEKEANEEDATPAPAKNENEAAAPAPTPAPTTPKPETTRPAAPAPAAPAPTSRGSVPVSGPSAVVPATGPSDVFFGIFVMTAITFVSLAFVQSNARLRRSALSR